MADFFQNGLYVPSPGANYAGRTWARWLWEWATKVIGYTDVDKSGVWDVYTATGNSGQSVVDHLDQLNIGADAYNFSEDDVGGYLTLTGLTPTSYDGIYRIVGIVDSKTVSLDIKYSIHENGIPCNLSGLAWKLWRPDGTHIPAHDDWCVIGGTGAVYTPYTWHLHIKVRNDALSGDFPEFMLSPFASWDPVGHAWSDNRYTSARGIDRSNNVPEYTNGCRVWAAGDKDRMMMMIRTQDNYFGWIFVYLGEIQPFNESLDPQPCIVATGSNDGSGTAGSDGTNMLGYGLNSNLAGGLRWLASDDMTTLSGYLALAHCPTSYDDNWVAGTYRRWNLPSRKRNLTELVCECRTSGYQEYRGTLKRIWASGREATPLRVFGANSEFLHTKGGVVIPWNGSRVWYERG